MSVQLRIGRHCVDAKAVTAIAEYPPVEDTFGNPTEYRVRVMFTMEDSGERRIVELIGDDAHFVFGRIKQLALATIVRGPS